MKSSLIFADLQKSAEFLADVLAQPRNDYMRAAAIQAFELCFELAWKYLQTRLAELGIEANSPRAAFREAGKAGLIDNVEAWLTFVEQRNLTTHTYKSQLADEVYAAARADFLPALQALLESASPDREV
jgi:nucleotidyltransferase substrate binding protein (TIGR01987 family)